MKNRKRSHSELHIFSEAPCYGALLRNTFKPVHPIMNSPPIQRLTGHHGKSDVPACLLLLLTVWVKAFAGSCLSDRGRAPDMSTSRAIEQRMEDFVTVFGDVPRSARKLEDYEARHHSDTWIQRLLGKGLACHYVIGYQLADTWWTFCFDRRDTSNAGDEEVWVVEAYDSAGTSWRGNFLYRPSLAQWRRGPPEYWLTEHPPGTGTAYGRD